MGRISSSTIDQINARIDIIALVNEYVRLERKGNDWWGCCPFHNEKTSSFHVRPEQKMYHCFGCGKGGGLINFYMEMEKLDFISAVTALAKKAGVEVVQEGGSIPIPQIDDTKEQLIDLYKKVTGTFQFFLNDSEMGKSVLNYLKSRGVSVEMIKTFCLGYAPADRLWLKKFLIKKGYTEEFLSKSGLFSKKYPDIAFFSDRLIFPIADRKGQIVAFGGRILHGDGPKYLNSGEMIQYKKGETLFAFNLALPEIRTTKSIILCEGYMDVIAYHQSGILRTVAPLGTALTQEQVHLIRSFADTIYLSFDSDEAGQKATWKAILLCRSAGLVVKIISIKGEKDPADVLLKQGADSLCKIVESAIIDMEYLLELFAIKYPINTVEGKAQASLAFFPYIDSLNSDIQKESCLEKIALSYNISTKALYSDFTNRNDIHNRIVKSMDANLGTASVKRNAEIRAVLAIVSNIQYFTVMRSALNSNDFEDPVAKNIFILLEECFRNDAVSYDSIFARCNDENIRKVMTETVTSGEFAENSKKTIEDSIRLVRRNSLERRRDRLVNKIRQIRGISFEEKQFLDNLINEKMNIDSELTKLKDTNE